jgi:hypothetical protein
MIGGVRIATVLLLCAGLRAQTPGFVSLIPEKDLSEHWTAEGAPASIWSLEKGVIACKGTPNGFLRSRKSYRNYVLKAEWRFEPKGWTRGPGATTADWPNAGFFIHAGEVDKGWPKSIEIQGHWGEAGSMFGVRGGGIGGAIRGPFVRKRPPLGSWERYEITSRDGKVWVVLNGEPVNHGFGARPPEGNICLQSEGWPVFYRRIEIKELP